MAGPEVGDPAPDFTLPGIENGQRHDFRLSDLRGHKVVLAFYPGDDTPGCTRQLCSYRDNFEDFERADAALLAISPQDVDSHERWADKRGFAFPLLADTEKQVIDAYGVGAPLINVRRSVFLVDEAGIVRYKHVAIIGAMFQKSGHLARVLEEM